MPLSNLLRILLAEDIVSDADLILRDLKRAGINFEARRVETSVDFRRELEDFKPDLILSDFSMPTFNGMDALQIARQAQPGTPFIFVSGNLGEENAIQALKNGATDYILKNNLLRLPSAVERAMKDVRERGVRQTLVRDLSNTEKRYRQVFLSHPNPSWVYDIGSSRILMVNDAAIARYGFTQKEFLAMSINDLLAETGGHGLDRHTEKHRTKGGDLLNVNVTYTDVDLDNRAARIVVATLIA